MSELKIQSISNGTRLKAKVDWVCVYDSFCDKWVGVCDELSLTVQADQQRELHVAIWEAMDCLFTMLVEDGELNNFLEEHGWGVQKDQVPNIKNLPAVNIRVCEESLAGAFA